MAAAPTSTWVASRNSLDGGGVTTAVPVAVNVVVSVPTVATRVFAPAVGPSVHEPGEATPSALVCADAAPMLPPPVTANATVTPAIGCPRFDTTRTVGTMGTAVPTVAVCAAAPVTATSCAGGGWGSTGSPPSPPQAARVATASRDTSDERRREVGVSIEGGDDRGGERPAGP